MINLNLARKYRSRNFEELIGQDIPVRMLKNSLFLNKMFPVYLFAGQRGCGKTSTARIFAAAINCKNLTNFQQKPTANIVPCLECESCKALINGKNPDFTEIDAASHTGVENVRQILETCSYLPVLGTKKIYLIDEAHMLSKAAFNAFLKVLEEPPKTALFILATTELQKFPETVLSRCFQVIFKPIEKETLKTHLSNICKKENIKIESGAIDIIIQESDGSARDALNLLERVRFYQEEITVEMILKALGKISESLLLELFEIIIEKNNTKLLDFLNSEKFATIEPQILWNMLIQLCRSLLWIKFKTERLPEYFNDIEKLKYLSEKISLNTLNSFMDNFFRQEEIFLKTEQKWIFLEKVLLDITVGNNPNQNVAIKPNYIQENFKTKNTQENFYTQEIKQDIKIKNPIELNNNNNNNNSSDITPKTIEPNKQSNPNQNLWTTFLDKTKDLSDPILVSILNQSNFIGLDEEKKEVKISLSNNSNFFKDKIYESKKLLIPILQEVFSNYINIQIENKPNTNNPSSQPKINTYQTQEKPKPVFINRTTQNPVKSYYKSTPFAKKAKPDKVLEITDEEKWPQATLITKYFPGKIRIEEQNNQN